MQNAETGRSSILIVDDESANREVLRRILEREGHHVTVAGSGKEALEQLLLPDAAMDLVLLDQRMPSLSGLDTLKQIRQRYRTSELPVIMVTAEGEASSVVQALDSGANDYITKPVEFPVLSARVRTQLAQLRAERRLRDSERRYALTALGSNDGFWEINSASGRLNVDQRWLDMLG